VYAVVTQTGQQVVDNQAKTVITTITTSVVPQEAKAEAV
jgi:hypothetical protein